MTELVDTVVFHVGLQSCAPLLGDKSVRSAEAAVAACRQRQQWWRLRRRFEADEYVDIHPRPDRIVHDHANQRRSGGITISCALFSRTGSLLSSAPFVVGCEGAHSLCQRRPVIM